MSTAASIPQLAVQHGRQLAPRDIVLGAIWISPGGGDNGDGSRPDPGQVYFLTLTVLSSLTSFAWHIWSAFVF